MLRWLTNWWDSIELWLTQLAFPFQVLLAVLVLLPACWALAGLADRAAERAAVLLLRRRSARQRARTQG